MSLAAAGRAQADWYTFVLQELNGLGTMLRFQDESEGAPAAATQARVREVLATLAWDGAAAVKQTWALAQQPLETAEDVWALYLVLQALEPDQKRVQDWLARLGPEARAVIANTPSDPTTATSHRPGQRGASATEGRQETAGHRVLPRSGSRKACPGR